MVLLGLLFLTLLGVSVFFGILIIQEKEAKLSKVLSFGGAIGSMVAFVFTGLCVGFFAIFAGDYEELWLDAGFYGALIGSLLISTFYVLYIVLNIRKWTPEVLAK